MNKNYPVEGLKELQAYLTALPKNLQRNAVSAGLRAAAKVVQEEAKLLVPKDSRQLEKAIKLSTPRRESEGVYSLRLRLRGKHSYLGPWLEWGVMPHEITVRDENGSLKIGKNFVGSEVLHPGHRARPFMRPALDYKGEEAVRAMATSIRAYIAGVKDKTGYDATAGMDED